MTIRAIIFDLDNCLCPASAVGEDLFAPAFSAMRSANNGALSDVQLEQAFAACWHTAFDTVAALHGFTPAMFEAGHLAFRQLEVTTPLVGYADLSAVRQVPVTRFLVTSGYRRLQESKVRALRIGSWFEEVIVDAIDDDEHPGKQKIFERIQMDLGLKPDQVLVVGDNPISELAAGRRLGMVTVQILRPGVTPSPEIERKIVSLDQLRTLVDERA